jgi:L-ascorbate metabolism protein UlaG (beta-lactamase superfamily)
MRACAWFVIAVVGCVGVGAARQAAFQTDTIKTASGDLQISFLGHSSLMFRYGDAVIDVDPVSQYADYAALPKADLVLVTHEHGDHLDVKAIDALRKDTTIIIGTAKCAPQVPGMTVMGNGETRTVGALRIDAVPAYNVVNKRPTGEPFHARGDGNGYVITFGDKRVYVAGDTENVPEIKALKNIDIAFLPMNLPYTMTPEMVADAAKALAPRILYPYHYGNTETSKLVALLANERGIELRIRNLK